MYLGIVWHTPDLCNQKMRKGSRDPKDLWALPPAQLHLRRCQQEIYHPLSPIYMAGKEKVRQGYVLLSRDHIFHHSLTNSPIVEHAL
jgi:hypothetical protein